MGKVEEKKRSKLRIVLVALVALLVVAAIAVAAYASDFYRADGGALAAVESTDAVEVRHLENGNIAFVPDEPSAGLVFYPGGKVQPEAYAPLLRQLAEGGVLCVLTPMPLNLAVLDQNAADGVQEQFPEVETWAIGGHSLGGAMAASYAAAHEGQWEGLVLLAAYSTEDLSESDLAVVSVYGSNDGVMNRESYDENLVNLPDDAEVLTLPGGNHAQFGSYGSQDGDGEAEISADEQQRFTADMVLDMLGA